jgi:hypothetical protein
MGKPITFKLKNESSDRELGTVIFNGKFVFILDPSITTDEWSRIGFIPLDPKQKKAESEDLFYYLNSRLPIELRKQSVSSKLKYIKNQGLRVASDSFALVPA